MTNPHYDIVIAGGGMVGATLALLLNQRSGGALRIAVVESFPQTAGGAPTYSPSFDARSTALASGSAQILQQLGLWPTLSRHLQAIETIHVSERGRFGSMTMAASELGWPALGYVVENAWLGNVLLTNLRQQQSISLLAPATVQGLTPTRSGAEVMLAMGDEVQTLAARLVVIADGAGSALREQLGIGVRRRSYRQTALIANVCFERAHVGCAFERFTDQGPLALLPLSDSERGEPRSALVWTLPNAQARALCEADEASFLSTLQQRFGDRLQRFTRVGARASYPLELVEAEEQVRRGIAVMGNAAHSLHPVAGQGFNLALRDCDRLAERVCAAITAGESPGELTVLQDYLRAQENDQARTVMFSDRVTEVFGHRDVGLGLLRGLGLIALDVLPPAKRGFVRHAAGMQDGAALGLPNRRGNS